MEIKCSITECPLLGIFSCCNISNLCPEHIKSHENTTLVHERSLSFLTDREKREYFANVYNENILNIKSRTNKISTSYFNFLVELQEMVSKVLEDHVKLEESYIKIQYLLNSGDGQWDIETQNIFAEQVCNQEAFYDLSNSQDTEFLNFIGKSQRGLYQNQSLAISENAEKLEAKFFELEEANEEKGRLLSQYQKNLGCIESKFIEETEKLNLAYIEIFELQEEIKKIAFKDEEIKMLKEKCSSLEGKIENENIVRNANQTFIEELQEKCSKADIEASKKDNQISELSKVIDDFSSENENLIWLNSVARKELNEKCLIIKNKKAEIDKTNSELKEIQDKYEEYKQNAIIVLKSYEENKDKTELNSEMVSRLSENLSEIEKDFSLECEKNISRIKSLELEISERDDKITKIDEIVKDKEKSIEMLSFQLETLNNEIVKNEIVYSEDINTKNMKISALETQIATLESESKKQFKEPLLQKELINSKNTGNIFTISSSNHFGYEPNLKKSIKMQIEDSKMFSSSQKILPHASNLISKAKSNNHDAYKIQEKDYNFVKLENSTPKIKTNLTNNASRPPKLNLVKTLPKIEEKTSNIEFNNQSDIKNTNIKSSTKSQEKSSLGIISDVNSKSHPPPLLILKSTKMETQTCLEKKIVSNFDILDENPKNELIQEKLPFDTSFYMQMKLKEITEENEIIKKDLEKSINDYEKKLNKLNSEKYDLQYRIEEIKNLCTKEKEKCESLEIKNQGLLKDINLLVSEKEEQALNLENSKSNEKLDQEILYLKHEKYEIEKFLIKNIKKKLNCNFEELIPGFTLEMCSFYNIENKYNQEFISIVINGLYLYGIKESILCYNENATVLLQVLQHQVDGMFKYFCLSKNMNILAVIYENAIAIYSIRQLDVSFIGIVEINGISNLYFTKNAKFGITCNSEELSFFMLGEEIEEITRRTLTEYHEIFNIFS